jgi:adenylate cyclase
MATAETRKLAAIMFTDIVGFSRQMGVDETRMLRLLEIHNQVIQQAVSEHHGTVIKTVGDAFLVDFPSVVHAVQCAQSIQAQFRAYNVEKPSSEQIHIRIGTHSGDIVQKGGDVFGDGVNIASRLQELAAPDTICISQVVYKEVEKKVALGTVVSLGKPKLKNIAERFQVYALLAVPPQGLRQSLQVQRLKFSRRVRPIVLVFVSVALVTGLLAVRSLSPLFPNPQPLAPSSQFLPLPDKPSIVVLPFTNMGNAPEQDYFSDGLTEDLTSDLSRISNLFVISRNTAFFYKGKAVKMPELSRELGVQYVLEGSVRKADGRVRITAQLIDATKDRHLWSERYDRPLNDIFTLQDEIVQQIRAALQVEVLEAELERVRRIPTDNLTAYDTLLRGLDSWSRAFADRNKDANAQARQLFERVVELDPNYAQAYAQLSLTYWLEWWVGWNPDPQNLERAGKLAQQAITLNKSLPEAHMVLGSFYGWQKQHDRAIAEAERAIVLDPSGAEWYVFLGGMLSAAGRPEEGIKVVERAMRLNPRFPLGYLMNLGFAYRVAGRYEEAIATAKQMLARQPNFPPAYFMLAFSYAQLDRLEEARSAGAELQRLNPSFSLERWKQIAPFKDPALVDRDLAALRKAGLK